MLGNWRKLRAVSSLWSPNYKTMTKQWTPLTAPQWAAISPFLSLKRKRKHDLRQILNIILWLLRTGSQWRNLPEEWPDWQAVYYYFNKWKKDGTFENLNIALNKLDRQQVNREADPSVFCIDSQSIKLSPFACEYRGMDAYKRVNAGPPVRAQTAILSWYWRAAVVSERTPSRWSRWKGRICYGDGDSLSERAARKSLRRPSVQRRFRRCFVQMEHPFWESLAALIRFRIRSCGEAMGGRTKHRLDKFLPKNS